ncbi:MULTISPECIES: aminopeptidase LapA [Legionella]|uniref:Aminopeptidase n=1 Tax=Legionella drozanskii LLAP-1 TaxID=1212489 RepID=A0A0W0SXD4_9GAMM|nr:MULTISPECIES: M20/M25/M40 family metallo-hydrolase [Legionella]KTC87995.1 aminopeptidase [Legionella drozanskii LLAP-1]PJE07323.1 MAG: aminopeptidase [Legionella sp.]
MFCFLRLRYLASGLLMALSPLVSAQTPPIEQIQLPQCLAAKLSQTYPVLAENGEFKIIELPSSEINPLALLADQAGCGRFVNLSHHFARLELTKKQQLATKLLLKPDVKTLVKSEQGYKIQHKATVNKALSKIDAAIIWQTLTHLTSYYNRSASQPTGVEAAEWLKSQFEHLAMEYGRQDTETYFVATGTRYSQPSLVTVIGKDNKEPAIVIGAHMDTLDGRMPGAGDDASGSATILEMTRILLASQTKFKHPIYIVWYAAEERGLVGSQFVVQDFMDKKIPVKAAIQFDMTGYRSDDTDPTMWIFRDYTDPQLSGFLAELIQTYIKVPVAYSKCGYGCSDHASWMAAGIPAAFPCETSFADHNPYIHTGADTMSLLNTEHLVNFTKLALAFTIELAK